MCQNLALFTEKFVNLNYSYISQVFLSPLLVMYILEKNSWNSISRNFLPLLVNSARFWHTTFFTLCTGMWYIYIRYVLVYTFRHFSTFLDDSMASVYLVKNHKHGPEKLLEKVIFFSKKQGQKNYVYVHWYSG